MFYSFKYLNITRYDVCVSYLTCVGNDFVMNTLCATSGMCVCFKKWFPNKRKQELQKEKHQLHNNMENTMKKAVILFHPSSYKHEHTVFRDLEKCAVWREMRDTLIELEDIHRELDELDEAN